MCVGAGPDWGESKTGAPDGNGFEIKEKNDPGDRIGDSRNWFLLLRGNRCTLFIDK